MLITRFSSFGTSALTRPILLFTLASLTITLIFTSLILAGGTSETATLRKFYLVSFKYNPDSAFYKTYEQYGKAKDKVEDVKDKGKEVLEKVNPFDKRANDNKDPSFKVIRVSYRGLCVEHSEGWDCAPSSDRLPEKDLEKDPLQLVEIADLYKDKIVWSVPFWLTLISTGIAYIMTIANSLPCFPSFTPPLWTKKLAVGMLGLAGLACLGGMVLSGVTTSSVAKLVDKVTMGAIVARQGKMVVVFGWVVFGLLVLAFLGMAAVVLAEWGVEKAQEVVVEKTREFVDVDIEDGRAQQQQQQQPQGAAAKAKVLVGGLAGFKSGGGIKGMKGNVQHAAGLAQTLRGGKK